MEFPAEKSNWNVFPIEEFDRAQARDPGNLGMEVMAQIRDNGRLLDHFRVALGGRDVLTVETNLTRVLRDNNVNTYRLRFQYWAKDIFIRRNATTSAWRGVYEMVGEGDAMILKEDGAALPRDDALKILKKKDSPNEREASIRWAVAVGDDGGLELNLVTLPASEDTINNKPLLKR